MKKLVYLISPNKIYNDFYDDLKKVLAFKNVKFFQLRLKKEKKSKIIKIAKKIRKITKKNKVKLIINDHPDISKIIKADGCHLGQDDISIVNSKKYLKKKIIGVTCHNSLSLAKKAIRSGASYIAFGAFNSSKTKKTKYTASIKILNKASKLSKLPIVAIGGINSSNYKNLLLNKADFLAISGYIWNNKKYKPLEAIEKLK